MRGLKYPDEFVIKFFFKNQLHTRPGRVVELGCGNGNNLLLFHEYGWHVTGLDISQTALGDAEYNFNLIPAVKGRHQFIHRDLSCEIEECVAGSFDIILMPNFLCYIPRSSAVSLLNELKRFVRHGTLVYLRSRTLLDYRYRRGEEVEKNGYRLAETVTGEAGMLNVFYDEWELVEMLKTSLALDMHTAEILALNYQNPQQGARVTNSDIIIWGEVGR